MPKLTFSGHESFTCRQFWLKKGYDFLHEGRRFTDPDAVVHLGVGKNMVSSIHYWLKCFDLVDEEGAPRALATYLLADQGKDPYLEQPGTLWLLHYLLVTRGRANLYDLVFNDFRREHPIFTKPQLTKYVDSYCQDANASVSTGSIQRDVEVFVRSYVQPQRKTASPEDDFATLLIDLELLDTFEVVKGDAGVRYTIERRQRGTLPWQIVLYAILGRYQGNSVSFRELANDHNGPGMVFALNEDGLLNQVRAITAHCQDIVFTDDAGIRELQFRQRPDGWEVLDGYYRA
jgi:hypothetical protein